MSVSLLPVRISHLMERPARKPRHRAVDEVDLLRMKRTWADSLIQTLRVQVIDAELERDDAVERRDIAEKALTQAEGVIRLRNQEIADLKRRLAVRALAEAAAAETQPIPVITPVMPLHKSPLANPAHVPELPHAEGEA